MRVLAPVAHRPALRALIAIGAVVLSGLVAVNTSTATAAEGDAVTITDAPALSWGFKQSWRTYVGPAALAGGAAQVVEDSAAQHNITWPFVSGTYDPATRTTELHFQGSARWRKYPGYGGLPPDQYALDLELSDPVITISRDSSTISAEVYSKAFGTDKDYGRIAIVDLAVDTVTPTAAGGVTTWSQIPTGVNVAAVEPFGEAYYKPGSTADALTFSYTGQGGAPDFSDVFATPGARPLALDGANVQILPQGTNNGVYGLTAVDQVNRLAYYRIQEIVEGVQYYRFYAFDLDAGQALDGSFVVPGFGAGALSITRFVDSSTGRVYAGDTTPNTIDAWYRYVRGQGFQRGNLASPLPTIGQRPGWDQVNRRAFDVRRVVPAGVATNAYDQHVWKLYVYQAADADGDTWTTKTYDLPGATNPLQNQSLYYTVGMTGAADGSLIVLGDARRTMDATSAPVPTTVPGAFRVVTTGDTATVEPVAGSVSPNSGVANLRYDVALSDPNGTVALLGTASGRVQTFDVTPPGGAAIAATATALPAFPSEVSAASTTIDPEDGSVWIAGLKTQRLVGVLDGQIVADQKFGTRSTRDAGLIAGPGHTFWMQSTELDANGTHTDTLVTHPVGLQKLRRVGIAATPTDQPESASVSLGVGQAAEDVTFSAAANGTPAPTLQWQAKAPGSPRYADVAGVTSGSFTVPAKPGMDGTQYRAVFTNAVGRVVSDVATLAVDFAPVIGSEPQNETVVEGDDAEFAVLGSAEPAPAITWQRRVGGYWQDVASDDNLVVTDVDGVSTLTVIDTNTEQSGSLFRAKYSNPVATVFSRTAALTVKPKVVIPSDGLDLEDVVLDWSGSEELQKAPPTGGSNYFSAGVSDGAEATYRASEGDVKVLQVSAGGVETAPTWTTRAAHVGNGGSQLVRLSGGTAHIGPDRSAIVTWTGSWSVNFYGGLVPFTVADPVLTVEADGTGELTADLSGYASSMDNPSERTPLPPVDDVTIATFSDVEIDPAGTIEVTPDYAGVEVTVPAAATPQNRAAAGWGAWPQEFVTFHVATGLSSYWYSSGGAADPNKKAVPFTVDFTAAEPGGGEPALVTPLITAPPASAAVLTGGSTTFTVTATGEQLSYRWQRRIGSLWVDVPDEAGSSLTLSGVVGEDAGQYRARVSNPVGAVTSAPATLTVTKQPANIFITAPDSSTYGEPVIVTVAIPDRTGEVRLTGLDVTRTQPLVHGTTTFHLPATLPAGAYTLQAAYDGDASQAAAQAVRPLVIHKAAVTIRSLKVTAEPTPNRGGRATLTVTCSTGVPVDGTVRIRIAKGGRTRILAVTVRNGTAAFALPRLTEGRWKLTATFASTADFSATSRSLTLRVARK